MVQIRQPSSLRLRGGDHSRPSRGFADPAVRAKAAGVIPLPEQLDPQSAGPLLTTLMLRPDGIGHSAVRYGNELANCDSIIQLKNLNQGNFAPGFSQEGYYFLLPKQVPASAGQFLPKEEINDVIPDSRGLYQS